MSSIFSNVLTVNKIRIQESGILFTDFDLVPESLVFFTGFDLVEDSSVSFDFIFGDLLFPSLEIMRAAMRKINVDNYGEC